MNLYNQYNIVWHIFRYFDLIILWIQWCLGMYTERTGFWKYLFITKHNIKVFSKNFLIHIELQNDDRTSVVSNQELVVYENDLEQ